MSNIIRHKRSSTISAEPLTTDLDLGELAINTYDGKLFLKKNDGADAVVEIGGGNVTKVGTPVNNQIGVWTGDGTIEGDTGLTWNGSSLISSGNITATGGVDKLTSATTAVSVAAATAPTAGQVLTATSSTAATWQAVSAGAGGATTQIQFNNAGSLDGNSGFTLNDTTAQVTLTTTGLGQPSLNVTNSDTIGRAIYATATGTGTCMGIWAKASGTTSFGCYGEATDATGGRNYGVFGVTASSGGYGGWFENTDGTDTEIGLATGTDLLIGSLDGVEKCLIDATGAGKFKAGTIGYSEIPTVGSAQTIDWTAGQYQKTTITNVTTFTFTAPAGPCRLILKIVNGGSQTLTWPSTVKWPGGTEPTWTTTGTDILHLYYDGTDYQHLATSLANA